MRSNLWRRIAVLPSASGGFTTSISKWAFDDWGYLMQWPEAGPHRLGRVTVVVEDIKFAFNAWLLLRSCCYFGTNHVRVMSPLTSVTPSMDIALRGNRIFHNHVRSGDGMRALSTTALKVALTPSHPKAVPLAAFDWDRESGGRQVQIVLGQENGLSHHVVEQCDAAVYIPQYGSVGSLSMNNALGICLSRASASLEARREDPSQMTALEAPCGVATQLSAAPFSTAKATRPHADEFLPLRDEEVKPELDRRRRWFPLGLYVMWENESRDRNIGATFRNLNCFNADGMLLLGRRAYNKRGTLGTHHYCDVTHVPSWDLLPDDFGRGRAAVWGLWCDYPYRRDYLGTAGHLPGWLTEDAVLSCDDTVRIQAEVEAALASGVQCIVIVVPEDGASLTQEAWARCDRLLRVSSVPGAHQVGLGPAVAVSIALERLRHCMVQIKAAAQGA